MVHIWCASLNLPPTEISKKYALLSADEKRRAGKKMFPKDRNRFIVARGTLRNILSRYLHINPSQIKFSYTSQGKPYLTDSSNCEGLCFNLSHSHDMALYAFTLRKEVGVDLEYIRHDFEWSDIEGMFLSQREKSRLREISENTRYKKYYTYWTRKEAFLKSVGTGLATDPKDVDVIKQSGQSDWVMQPNQIIGSHRQWSLLDLDLGSGYAASLAVEGKDIKLKCWKW
jgi:4'-phosphopantetheinyl transferase